MFVRIGLVITGIVLIVLLFLGIGFGLGYVRIASDGIAFGKVDDSDDASSEGKVVSADELLRRKGVSLDQPAPQLVVEAPKPVAPITAPPVIAQTPPVVSNPPKTATPDKPAPAIVSEKPADPPSRADVRTKAIIPETSDDGRKGKEKDRRDVVQRDADNRDPGKRKVRTGDADTTRDNAKPAGPSWVIRVAAGYDKPITDPAGNEWEAASGFEGGEVKGHGEINIENSRFPALYRQERWNMRSWKRKIPTGNYIVLLHFAELSENITAAKQRVFGVEVKGQPLMKLDVFAEAAGPRHELIKAIPVRVADNVLSIRFVETGKHHPILSGIEVIPMERDKGRGLTKDELRRRENGFRVAAGSAVPISERGGTVWLPDLGFEGGQTVDRGAITVENALFPDLFRSEHFGMSAWHADMPNGDYTVNLHFAETWEGITAPNQRVFHVTVQDTDLHDLDIFKESGGLRHALVKTFHVSVTNGKLTIQFQNTDKNVAEINGIEVIREK